MTPVRPLLLALLTLSACAGGDPAPAEPQGPEPTVDPAPPVPEAPTVAPEPLSPPGDTTAGASTIR